MSDHDAYRRFMRKAEFEKAVNSLLGLVEGIAIDARINDREVNFSRRGWMTIASTREGIRLTSYSSVVEHAVADGVLTEQEWADITWLCRRLTSADYFNAATASMQKLHAVVAGIGSDGEISVDELNGLSAWIQEHEQLKTCWPYDEIESLVTSVLADQKIDPEEHRMLLRFFGEFVAILDGKTIVSPVFLEGKMSLACARFALKFPSPMQCSA